MEQSIVDYFTGHLEENFGELTERFCDEFFVLLSYQVATWVVMDVILEIIKKQN